VPGASVSKDITRFAVRSPLAQAVTLCLFVGGTEQRVAMQREGDVWTAQVPGDLTGAHYGYRAEGEWAPERGRWFDPAKLLVDPYAVELDRRFVYDPRHSLGSVVFFQRLGDRDIVRPYAG
jgi:glycogen operon protein